MGSWIGFPVSYEINTTPFSLVCIRVSNTETENVIVPRPFLGSFVLIAQTVSERIVNIIHLVLKSASQWAAGNHVSSSQI